LMTHRGPFQPLPFCDSVKRVVKDSEVSAATLNTSWLGKDFDMFGFSLLGWLTSLLQSLVTVVIVIIVSFVTSYIKSTITNSISTVKYAPLNPAPEIVSP